MSIVILIVGALLILFFIFLTYKFTETWRWFHVTIVFLVFLASLGFLVLASLSLKTRAAWMAEVDDLEGRVERLQAEVTQLQQEGGEGGESVRQLQGELSRLVLDRGRVWRQCIPQRAVEEAIELATVPPDVPEDQVAPNLLEPQDFVYVFTEREGPEGLLVPEVYLGTFQVEEATDTTATISPLRPLDELQMEVLRQGGTTWVMYEIMPLDNHFIFAQTPPDDEHMFGRQDEELIRRWYRNRYNVPEQVYESRIQDYVRNGTAADDEDLPEHRWVRVEFEETHEVLVDSEETRAALEGGYFDTTGRAVASAVRAGEPVTFQSGDTALFIEDEATPLIDAGIATLVARYFVRPLNDYDYSFANFDRRGKQLDDAIYITERNYETVNDGLEKVENSISYRNEEKGKLEDELAKFEVEREVIAQYHQQLEEHWAQTRREINELYRTNLLLERRLVEAQQQLQEETERHAAVRSAP